MMDEYMKKIITMTILTTTALLSGCAMDMSSTQPTNSAPQPTVKQVAGKIQQGHYISRIGKAVPGQMSIPASFSVMVPQTSNPDEYQYTQVSDQQGPNYTSVRFGPGWHDQTIYRLTVSKPATASPFNSYSSVLLKETVKRMHAAGQSMPIKLYQSVLSIKHHPVLFAVYQQTDKSNNDVLTQAIYIWQQGHYAFEAWLTGSSASQINPVNGVTRFEVVKHQFSPFAKFINSVTVAV
jgi:hypothetical protein